MSGELSKNERAELERCEAVIERGLPAFVEVGTALLKIRDGTLYRKTHATFEQYCRERWGISRSRVHQLVEASRIVNDIVDSSSTMVDELPPPSSERQVRLLAPLSPKLRREVWKRAIALAPNGKPTSRHVKAAIDEIVGDATPGKSAATNGQASRDLPGQTTFLPDDEGSEEEVPVEPGVTVRQQTANFQKSVHKVLGLVGAVEDFTVAELARGWSQESRDAVAELLRDLHTKIGAWIDYLGGNEA